MKRLLSILLTLTFGCLTSLDAQKGKKKGLDFERDIQPILEALSPEQRSLVLDWAEEGAPIPLVGKREQ
jgi:hypothetical protein